MSAWTSSPSPGGQTTIRASARATIAVSDSPVPTVSTRMRSKPQASKASTGERRARQAAELAAGRERADEDVRVRRVRAHSDPVAEDGTTAHRTRRIDRDHRHRAAFGEPGAEQRVDERRLAASGDTGDADDQARPARPASDAATARAPGWSSSSSVSNRASGRRSPAIARSARRAALVVGAVTFRRWRAAGRSRGRGAGGCRSPRSSGRRGRRRRPRRRRCRPRVRRCASARRGPGRRRTRSARPWSTGTHRGGAAPRRVGALDRRAVRRIVVGPVLVDADDVCSPESIRRWKRIAEAPIMRCTRPASTTR